MENLGIDIKLLVAQLTNFILFFIIFKKFIAKPFAAFLKDEKAKEEAKETLDKRIKDLEIKEKADEKKLKEKFEKDREKMIRQAKEQAEKVKTEAMKSAEEEVARMKAKAQEDVAKEKKLAESGLKKEIVELSVSLVETGLKNYLSPSARKEITDMILKNSQKTN